ncbi:MAG TPA: hypothetical protein VI685_13230 [Candidatus Angelobacter sp.]
MLPRITLLALAVVMSIFGCDGGNSVECRQRGAALSKRVEELKQKAQAALKIGSSKAEVSRFYKENDIPLDFDQFGATGTIRTSGCSPFGCGSNDAIIGVRVELDREAKVKKEPHVMAMYTDCL